MAGVQSVTYNSASKSSGWSDGITIDENGAFDINQDGKNDNAKVNITRNNAKYIVNDAQSNKTDISPNEISKARQGGTTGDNRAKLLVEWSGDDVKYDEDASRKNGQDKIDTSETVDKDDEKKGGAIGGGVAAGASALAAIAAVILSKEIEKDSPSAWIAPACAILAVCAAGVALAFSFPGTFDKNLAARKNQTDKAESTNSIIDEARDTNNANSDMMIEEMDLYAEKSAEITDMQQDFILDKTEIESELKIAEAQGDKETVKKLKEEMKGLEGQGEEISGEGEELDTYKDNLDLYTSSANESLGVHDSGTKVSNFMKQGQPFVVAGQTAGALSALAAAVSAIPCMSKNGVWDFLPAIAATVIFVVCAGISGMASKNFFDRAKEEGNAVTAGNGMDEHLSTLQTSADCALDTAVVNTDSYVAEDKAKEEAIAETQKGATEKLAEQKVPPEEIKDEENEEEEEPTINLT